MKETVKPIGADELFREFEQDAEYRAAGERLEGALRLAANVLRLRARHQMSQKELAERAGMRQPRIADIEGAKANPRLDTLQRIAAALSVDLGELFDRCGKADSTTLPPGYVDELLDELRADRTDW